MSKDLPGITNQPAPDNTMRLLPADFWSSRGLPDPNITDPYLPTGPAVVTETGAARIEAAAQRNRERKALPDPNITGPCQLQSSILCEPSAGRQRMDPMDMATSETSFRAYVMCCQPCYDAQADEYIRVTHGRA